MAGPPDHRPDDFNVAAGAGVTLDALASGLAPEGQWLALDPPGGGGVSVGGVVADGRAGPLGALFGRPRDLLLGLTVVDGAGRILRLGGRVVKNVAGFDLVRLVAGSRGGLGMITEAVFRLHPLPAADLTLVWGRDDARGAWELGRRLAALRVPLAAAEVVAGDWPEPLGAGPARVLLRLMGSASAARQIALLLEAEAGKPDEAWGRQGFGGALPGPLGGRGAGVRRRRGLQGPRPSCPGRGTPLRALGRAVRAHRTRPSRGRLPGVSGGRRGRPGGPGRRGADRRPLRGVRRRMGARSGRGRALPARPAGIEDRRRVRSVRDPAGRLARGAGAAVGAGGVR